MNEEFELSDREIDIIRLVSTGASNKEIAQKLFISPNTVKVHLRNIFGKLNVVSRTEATMVAIRMGWVDSPKNETSGIDQKFQSGQNEIEENSVPITNNKRRNLLGALGFFLILIFAANIYFFLFLNNRENNTNNSIATNQAQQTQRWKLLSPMAVGVKNMAAIRYEQSFFIFGGETKDEILDSVLIYNISKDVWFEGNRIPKPLSQIQSVLFGEKIYIPGGVTEDGKATNQLAVYDPREDLWELKSQLPYKISRYGLVSYEGKIYLFGGWDGYTYRKEILIYDPLLDSWQEFSELKQPLADFGIAVMGAGIHIIGGQNDEGAQSLHQIFIPQRVLDQEDPWSEDSPIPQPRYGMGTSVLADMLYVVGGENEDSSTLPLIQYLAPSGEWIEVEKPIDDIGSFAVAIPFETRLYVMGGELSSEIKSTNQVFQAVYTILVPIITQ